MVVVWYTETSGLSPNHCIYAYLVHFKQSRDEGLNVELCGQ